MNDLKVDIVVKGAVSGKWLANVLNCFGKCETVLNVKADADGLHLYFDGQLEQRDFT